MTPLARTASTLVLSLALAAPAFGTPTIERSDLKCSGIAEARDRDAASFDHNLRLVFAQENGAYIGDVTTEIAQDGQPVALIECSGPWVLADLPPGTYDLTTSYDGKVKTDAVRVREDGLTEEIIVY